MVEGGDLVMWIPIRKKGGRIPDGISPSHMVEREWW